MFKYLRIAVTVLSLKVCVLPIALWVWSYNTIDEFRSPALYQNIIRVVSLRGRLVCNIGRIAPAARWKPLATVNNLVQWQHFDERYGAWGWRRPGELVLPHWFALLLASVVAILPWIKLSFSLRALPIATTLVAAMLGLIVAARYDAVVLKYLRIAVTALSLTACVLLMALWVRSRERYDYLQTTTFGLQRFTLSSSRQHISGTIYFGDGDELSNAIGSDRLNKLPPGVKISPWAWGRTTGGLSAIGPGTSTQYFFAVPHWFLVAVTAVLALAPWITAMRRFSLRTLLITTTLVAILLGLIVAAQ